MYSRSSIPHLGMELSATRSGPGDEAPAPRSDQTRFETARGQGAREGRWTTWFDNGKKRSEGGYLDGEMHGPFTLWYESGSKREDGQYVRGRAHGRWVKWDEQGKKIKEVEFRHGVKVS
jgi:antitoxin component YwqK of YwqJK toxin-antitoxin module